jgi:hypothetical protein
MGDPLLSNLAEEDEGEMHVLGRRPARTSSLDTVGSRGEFMRECLGQGSTDKETHSLRMQTRE